MRWEEQRKTLQADAAAKAQLAQYNDELARKRAGAEHEQARARNAELVVLQEEGARRAEAEKARVAAAKDEYPLGKGLWPIDVAEAALALIEGFSTMTGESIRMDAGQHLDR